MAINTMDKKGLKFGFTDTGFTLLEVIIILVISSILVSLAVPSLFGLTERARFRLVVQNVNRRLLEARSRSISDMSLRTGVYFDLTSDPQRIISFYDDDDDGTKFKYDHGTDEIRLSIFEVPPDIEISVPAGNGIVDNVVVFRSNGIPHTGGTIQVASTNGLQATLQVLETTGRIRFLD